MPFPLRFKKTRDGWTERPTNRPFYRDAWTHLKMKMFYVKGNNNNNALNTIWKTIVRIKDDNTNPDAVNLY